MTLDDLRELVRVTAAEHGDSAGSIAKIVGVKDRTAIWKWLAGDLAYHWPNWVSAYLESRGITIIVKRTVAQNATAPKNP